MLEDLYGNEKAVRPWYGFLLQLGALSVAMIAGSFILGILVTLSKWLIVYLLGLL